MLHLINKSPYTSNDLQCCVRFVDQDKDAILLLEDGVIAASRNFALKQSELAAKFVQTPCYALREDLTLRGLESDCDPRIEIIDFDKFVHLTTQHTKTQTWA